MSDLLQARQALGSTLRKLRREAGLSVRSLANACVWLPSKVVLLENGRELPTHHDIAAWAAATSNVHVAPEVHEQLVVLESLFRSWHHQSGETSQRRWREMEANARYLRVFEPHFVPGLLQTAAYARLRLQAHARLHYASDDVEGAVAARLKRQEILQTSQTQIHFLMTEFAFRSGAYAAKSVMADQVEKILRLPSGAPVRLGILPLYVEWGINVDHGFWMFDSSHVVVETVTAELRITEQDELATYWRVFHTLADKAVYGERAEQLLRAVLDRLVQE